MHQPIYGLPASFYRSWKYEKIDFLSKESLCVDNTHNALIGKQYWNAITTGVLHKNVFLKVSQISQENTCVRLSCLIKLQADDCNFLKKETLVQVFSCEFFEIFSNTFVTEHLRVIAFKYWKLQLDQYWYFKILNSLHLS